MLIRARLSKNGFWSGLQTLSASKKRTCKTSRYSSKLGRWKIWVELCRNNQGVNPRDSGGWTCRVTATVAGKSQVSADIVRLFVGKSCNWENLSRAQSQGPWDKITFWMYYCYVFLSQKYMYWTEMSIIIFCYVQYIPNISLKCKFFMKLDYFICIFIFLQP